MNPRKININVISIPNWRSYTRGWPYCLRYLHLLHSPDGVDFIDHADRILEKLPDLKRPWVGVLHNTPHHHPMVRELYPSYLLSLSEIFTHSDWSKVEERCRGIFTFSEYTRRFISENSEVSVVKLIHPTKMPRFEFNYDQFLRRRDKRLVLVGSWLRDYQQIFDLRLKNYAKYILQNNGYPHMFHLSRGIKTNTGVGLLPTLSDREYDVFLTENVVFLPLYDSAVNNTVLECIVRNTPLLVTRLPATVEYLGEDYPLFYSDLREAEEKVSDFQKIKEAHLYLAKMDKTPFTARAFVKSIVNSNIYKRLLGAEIRVL